MSATTTTGPGKKGLDTPLIPLSRNENAAFVDGLGPHAPRMTAVPGTLVTEVTGGTHVLVQAVAEEIAAPVLAAGGHIAPPVPATASAAPPTETLPPRQDSA